VKSSAPLPTGCWPLCRAASARWGSPFFSPCPDVSPSLHPNGEWSAGEKLCQASSTLTFSRSLLLNTVINKGHPPFQDCWLRPQAFSWLLTFLLRTYDTGHYPSRDVWYRSLFFSKLTTQVTYLSQNLLYDIPMYVGPYPSHDRSEYSSACFFWLLIQIAHLLVADDTCR
jgi:hypothetical protein